MINNSNSYFSVPHSFTVYLTPWNESRIPSEDELRQMQSVGLKLLSEVKALEASCLLQLRQLDNEAKAVVDFLKLQSRKVDLVLQHVLEKESQSGEQFHGKQFGGSGLTIESPNPFTQDDRFLCHVYLHSEVVALLCLCQVDSCHAITAEDDTSLWQSELSFVQILDEDVEQLVKASLTVQQKQLKLRKAQRDHSK